MLHSGRLCHTVQIKNEQNVIASAESCLMVPEPPAAKPEPEAGPTLPSGPTPAPESPSVGPAPPVGPVLPSGPPTPGPKPSAKPPSLSVKISPERPGPAKAGEMVIFIATVTNTGSQTLHAVRVVMHLNPTLKLHRATRGASKLGSEAKGDAPAWTLPTLEPKARIVWRGSPVREGRAARVCPSRSPLPGKRGGPK